MLAPLNTSHANSGKKNELYLLHAQAAVGIFAQQFNVKMASADIIAFVNQSAD